LNCDENLIPEDWLRNRLEKEIDRIVAQMYTYLRHRRIAFGILTRYDITFFFKSDENGYLYVSRPVLLDEVLRYMAAFLLMGNAFGEINHPQMEDSFNLSLEKNEKRKRKREEKKLRVDREHLLGSGSTGTVYEAFLDNERVAVKIADVYHRSEVMSEMTNEVAVYKFLEDLQGVYIPQLLWSGYLLGRVLFGIVFELCDSDVDFSEEEKHNVLDALHERGVIHRDARRENFVRSKNTGNLMVIDFGIFLIMNFASIY